MNYSIDQIVEITQGKLLSGSTDQSVNNIIYDTRKISYPDSSLFIAFKGSVNDGHDFIQQAYDKGIRAFIISKRIKTEDFENARFILVNSSLHALQNLAKHHRESLNVPILAITGSNGKTIVKEWLSKCLSHKIKLVKSPKSYNSQIGVALSLLQISEGDELAIIEAGISQKHEMRFLERMIKPLYGIFTNIGDAHSSGFDSMQDKIEEKLLLFKDSETVVYNADQTMTQAYMESLFPKKAFAWSKKENSSVSVHEIITENDHSLIKLSYKDDPMEFRTHFQSEEFLENLLHVISFLILFNYSRDEIQTLIEELDQLQNRLELKEGQSGNLLINDSYSLDMASLQLALEFQDIHANGREKVLIISDLDHQKEKESLFRDMNQLIQEKEIDQIYAVGIDTQYHDLINNGDCKYYASTEEFLRQSHYYMIKDSCILIKGARRFRFENVFQRLSKKIHQTILESNFSALDHNLKFYGEKLNSDTKLMTVIKAEAYGSGSEQIAHFLEQKKLDYLAVAILDEAIKIRESECSLPIMVFNVQEDSITALWEFELEPEVYSISLLNKLIAHSEQIKKPLKIHLKIDTGMNRLGFMESEISSLIEVLQNQKYLSIASVFSHLAASDMDVHDDFTNAQATVFRSCAEQIEKAFDYPILKHILNTAGIIRFPDLQMDMVRLGLGLYGIDETGTVNKDLEKVHSLKAKILQIKTLQPGESTGYNRSGMVDKETPIAIVSIGYADGLMRMAGNGNYHMLINGVSCPTIGNVCMDVCMLDISECETAKVGDEVIVFSKEAPIEALAKACNTISYEIISRIASRVKRVYTYQ